jgi:hypothetical protein
MQSLIVSVRYFAGIGEPYLSGEARVCNGMYDVVELKMKEHTRSLSKLSSFFKMIITSKNGGNFDKDRVPSYVFNSTISYKHFTIYVPKVVSWSQKHNLDSKQPHPISLTRYHERLKATEKAWKAFRTMRDHEN